MADNLTVQIVMIFNHIIMRRMLFINHVSFGDVLLTDINDDAVLYESRVSFKLDDSRLWKKLMARLIKFTSFQFSPLI